MNSDNNTLFERRPDEVVAFRPARKLASFAAAPNVRWMDRAARFVISSFGLFVLLAIALILIFIGKEAAPLFLPAKSKEHGALQLPSTLSPETLLSWSMDEYQIYTYGLSKDGHLYFVSTKDGTLQRDLPITDLLQHPPHAAWVSPAGDCIVASTQEGKIKVLTLSFDLTYDSQDRQVLEPKVKESPLLAIPGVTSNLDQVAGSYNPNSGSVAILVRVADGRLFAGSFNAMGQSLEMAEVKSSPAGPITAMSIDGDVRYAMLCDMEGKIYRWDLSTSAEKPHETIQLPGKGRHVTALRSLNGDTTFILGLNDGSIEAWFGVRKDPSDTTDHLTKVRSFTAHHSAIAGILPSSVSRGFWTYDVQGVLKMHFNPSARQLYSFDLGTPICAIAANSHLNGISAQTSKGELRRWELDNPHPEVSWRSLFGKVWYEGYPEPLYIWQSSSGSDNAEPKLSLTPLAFGTLKGAFFGLIFAIPVSVMSAIYVSQLMRPHLRSVIKPTLEIMAALPSVVIGFLAGLWIAPFLESHLLSFVILFPTLLGFLLLGSWYYHRLPLRQRNRIPQEIELSILFGLIVLAMAISHWVSAPIENAFFGGNIQQWIFDTTGQKVEQRNSLVIGLAMGIAVIPVIFAISEDALSNVPRHYVSASLALGATRWQSAIRVVLPTASPGIFSAIMLGFGRAVGETMIVLMATGNTPIMSWSPLNGMRTLSANIAVEIPEAPFGGTLYRILFLAAALLFVLTFFVNTLSEMIRQRLREKYRAL